MKSDQIIVSGKVIPGHQVASGLANDSRYPQGTIEMQLPFFKALGLDLSEFYLGTLNVSVAPKKFKLTAPALTFKNVEWTTVIPPETFSFSPCEIIFEDRPYAAYIYCPHPETKVEHFQDASTIEIIAHKIPGIKYGDSIELALQAEEVSIY